jgi:hypothetical protein
MTRAFKLLVDAAGAENIALGLDSNLNRIAELTNGERFTAETAFHMETALGLPDGYFYQPNPVLTADLIARLRAPLKHRPPEDEANDFEDRAANYRAVAPAPEHVLNKSAAVEEVEMAKRANRTNRTNGTNGTSSAVDKTHRAAGSERSNVSASASRAKGVSRSRSAEIQPSLALVEAPSVLEIRRANLHVLTARNGSKALLGRMLNISQSNMAHRLHGKKRLDDTEATRFTEVLGLPAGWLDTPRQSGDVPPAVEEMLTPASRARVAAQAADTTPQQEASPITNGFALDVTEASESESAFDSDSDSDSDRNSQPTLDEAPLIAQENGTAGTVGESREVPGNNASSAPDAFPSTSMTDLTGLIGISPIAEALLKTLAGKARTGRLNESQALQLLQQVVLL